jgi:dTDP-4-amino-4,6-dideoxygalactose transaminase
LALQLALRAFKLENCDIITTPFSYVATTSSILWEKNKPIFVDIQKEDFNINADYIEKAITKDTKAIMAVHVFGRPCAVEQIEQIAQRYNLKVIYDGAHCFGSVYKGRSLLSYGDIATCSFHATKVFHTIEGGCVISHSQDIHDQIGLLKSFGHIGDHHLTLGINAKASEFQAMMGLINFAAMPSILKKRAEISNYYNRSLSDLNIIPFKNKDGLIYNYSYYPVLLRTEAQLLELIKIMNDHHVFPRRYFYPSLNGLSYLGAMQPCPVSEDCAKRILCLPLYTDLTTDDQDLICDLVKKICA